MARVSTSENAGSSSRMLKNRGYFFSSCFLLTPVLHLYVIAVVLVHPAALNSEMSLKFGGTLCLDAREKPAFFFKNGFNSMWV